MSISILSGNIIRIERELADLSNKISQETKKESELLRKILQIEKSITSSKKSGVLTKMNDIERKRSEIAKIQSKRADLSKKEADKRAKLLKYKQDLIKLEEQQRKKVLKAEKKQQQEQIRFQQELQRELKQTSSLLMPMTQVKDLLVATEYDLFISHASEDKNDFVRPLAEILKEAGIKVWYDEFTLKVGDSLRRSIDNGLSRSKFGTVVLSSSFFSKNWTQYELDGMVAKEIHGHKMILPIWHKVSKSEVLNYSPTLADKVALNSSLKSIEEIAQDLIDVVRPAI